MRTKRFSPRAVVSGPIAYTVVTDMAKNALVMTVVISAVVACCPSVMAQQTFVSVQQTPITTTTTTTTVNPNGTSTTSTNIQIQNFQTPPLPTDVTRVPNNAARDMEMVAGEAYRSRVPRDSGVIVARDPRFVFSGRWWHVQPAQEQVAVVPGGEVRTFSAVIPRVEADTAGGADTASVMSTVNAKYAVTGANELTLGYGAMLIKGGKQPLHVLMPVGVNTAVVRIEEGTFAMVANMSGHVSVANLADTHAGACRTLLTDRRNNTLGALPTRIGHMMEIYPNVLPAGEHRSASYIALHQLRLVNGLTVETMRLNYPHAMKRFNLTRVLSDADFRRVMKTAAAVSFTDRNLNSFI